MGSSLASHDLCFDTSVPASCIILEQLIITDACEKCSKPSKAEKPTTPLAFHSSCCHHEDVRVGFAHLPSAPQTRDAAVNKIS